MELTTTIFTILSILLLAIQIHLAAKAIRDDHDRRRSQATLEYIVRDIRLHWGDRLKDITSLFNNSVPMPPEALKLIQADAELRSNVKRVLASIEHMALGVNIGVFDLAVVNRSSGKNLLRIYNQFLPYIRQSQTSHPTAYKEFGEMIESMKLLRSDT